MIAQTVSPEKIARASLKLSPFFKDTNTGRRYHFFRDNQDGAAYGPAIIASEYKELWNVENRGDGERIAHHVTKKEATALAREMAMAEWIAAHTDYAGIPAIGGGSHEADTEVADAVARNRQREASNAQKMTLEAAQDAALEVGAMFGKSVHIYRTLKDGTPKSDGGWYRFEIDNTQRSAGYRNLANLLDGLRDMVKTWQETQPTPAQPKKQAKPRKNPNRATSQKRDNQRAQRAALNEAYKAHAAGKASEVSDILTAFGFTIISTRDNDGTPVTIWQDTNPQEIEGTNPDHIAHATIKQTPYSLRIYNGQPARLPRHGDAELINRVEHGWCACGEARGYAAGLADAILRLIETPDPYMQALDAMEAREAEQSAPTLDTNPPTDADRAAMQAIDKAMQALRPIESLWSDGAIQPYANDRAAMYRRLQRAIANAEQTMQPHIYAAYMAIYQHDRRDMQILSIANAGEQSPATPPADYVIAAPGHDGRPVIIADVEHHDVSDNLGVLVIRNGRAELVYPERPTIAEAALDDDDNLPDLVLRGGQPSMSGPWELPAISGGSQDAEEPEHIRFSFNASRINETLEKIGRPDLKLDVPALTADDYCVRCGQPATRWVEHHANWYAECDDCAKLPTVEPRDKDACQHDADTPAARFCSQCGHDAHPDAPQPTDTGDCHDVPTNCPICDQRYTARWDFDRTCATTWSTPETLHGHTSAETAYLVDDYPYGARLRCQIRYWVESGKDGRQRFVSQTCNPKTGKWNNPKKSTYSEVMVMTRNDASHIKYTALGSWPTECEMRRMETLLGEHITEAQASIIRQWRIMNQAQKHITYTVTSTGPLDIMHSAEDRATAAAFDATRQTKEEVNAVWNTAINRAVKELETA